MQRTANKPSSSELRKIGRQLLKLCRTNPLDGASADEAIRIIREHERNPEVINSHSIDGLTPIMHAYALKSPLNDALTDALLRVRCTDVSRQYADHSTLLHLAAKRGDDRFAALLLERNTININARDNTGHTALMHACYLENGEQVAALLKHDGIDINASLKNGLTALTIATRKSLIAAEHLIQCQAILVNTIHKKEHLITNALCEAILGMAFNSSTTLWDDFFNRKIALIQHIIDKGADLSFRYRGLGHHKIERVHSFWSSLETINKKIYVADDKNGSTPLMLAAICPYEAINTDVVRLLLKAGADYRLHDDNGKTAEQHARSPKTKQIIQDEIERRAACWPRRKQTLFARTIVARSCVQHGFPRDLTAMITSTIFADDKPESKLNKADKALFTLHNHEIVDQAYRHAKLHRK